LAVWIFAAAISLPKTGNKILQPCPRFRPLHSNGKTVCTTAADGRFCGGSAPALKKFCVNNSKKHLTKRFMG